jgi:NADPH-ferrihemoprotein reductase
VVFWGSQGGTAEAIATRYAAELEHRFRIRATPADLADYDHQHLTQSTKNVFAVFVLATYGDGDPTDNALAFAAQIRSMVDQKSDLGQLKYAIFGLGNTNYRLYNQVAIDTDRMLLEMGATRIGALGLGDDSQGSTEEDFLAWKTETDCAIAHAFRLRQCEALYAPQWNIRAEDELAGRLEGIYQGEPVITKLEALPSTERVLSDLHVLPITSAVGVGTTTKDCSRHCLHVELDLHGVPAAKYDTGDYLQVWPINPEDEVRRLLTILGLWDTRKVALRIRPAGNKLDHRVLIPSPVTAEVLFRHYFEICGAVSRDTMQGLLQFVPAGLSKEKFATVVNNRESFRNQVTARQLTFAQAVGELLGPNVLAQLPLSYVLEHFKRLQPRSYSISSSSHVDPYTAAITILATTETLHADGQPPTQFKGLASNYILHLKRELDAKLEKTSCPQKQNGPAYLTHGPGERLSHGKIFAQFRRSDFKLPVDPATPVIMIGSGTGVAPFRAFVQERMQLALRLGSLVGETILIVGHRSPNEDYYYQTLWQQAQEVLGAKFTLFTAFSREARKTYVQDIVRSQRSLMLDTLGEKKCGTMYICGSSSMARGVKDTLASIWGDSAQHFRAGPADEWIASLRKARRLQEDSWG